MKRFVTLIACLVSLSLTSLAMAGAAWLAETWSHPGGLPVKYSKVLVVGITSDDALRRSFENKFVTHLRAKGIECVTSHSIVPDLGSIAPSAEVVDRLLAEKVDAVITVHPAAPDRYAGGGATIWDEQLAAEVTVRGYVESALAEGVPDGKRRVVDVGLWDGATRGRIWAARTEAHKRDKLRKSSGEIVQEVISRLRSAAVI